MKNLKISKRSAPKLRNDAGATIESAIATIVLVHGAPGLLPKHRELIITSMLWKVTEAQWGKQMLPFRTSAALTCAHKLRRHEHVFPRSRIVQRILRAKPEEIGAIVRNANVACLVEKHEADALNAQDKAKPHLDGWDRYRELGIHVVMVDEEGRISDFIDPARR